MDINGELINKIDAIGLSDRILAWKKAMRAAPWRLCAEREKYAAESWRETEGEDLELRRARLIKNILDNIEIAIHDTDVIVGRPTPYVIGTCTAIDICGDYIPDLWDEDGEINLTMNADAGLDRKSLEILRESARVFAGKTAPEMTAKAWDAVYGTWPTDVTDAKIKDPTIDIGIFGQVTSVLAWKKLLSEGLGSTIREAECRIAEFRDAGDSDVDKLYFWQAAVIVCRAVIDHARRYAALARQTAAKQTNHDRRNELLNTAEILEHVPENPARTFQEALQAMAILNVCKLLEHPMHNNAHWGRGDQYLYPYFINDIRNGTLTVERAGALLAELIGRWGTQIFVTNESQRQSHQVNFGINNVLLGGLDREGKDAANELSYLFLHMVGLLQLSSPTVGIRWNSQTPHWLMLKAIETNMKTRGGIPLFQNDEVMIRHYMDDGIPYEEACEWSGSGASIRACRLVPSITARRVSRVTTWPPYRHDAPQRVAVTGKQLGLPTGDPRDFRTFEALYDAFKAQHRFFIDRIFRLAAIARKVQPNYVRLPLLSTLGLPASMELAGTSWSRTPITRCSEFPTGRSSTSRTL
jgi:formate C-acetyltransferase